MEPIPVVLFGEAYWRRIVNFDAMVEEGMIGREDLAIFRYVGECRGGLAHRRRHLRLCLRRTAADTAASSAGPPKRRACRAELAEARPTA